MFQLVASNEESEFWEPESIGWMVVRCAWVRVWVTDRSESPKFDLKMKRKVGDNWIIISRRMVFVRGVLSPEKVGMLMITSTVESDHKTIQKETGLGCSYLRMRWWRQTIPVPNPSFKSFKTMFNSWTIDSLRNAPLIELGRSSAGIWKWQYLLDNNSSNWH